LAWHATHTVRPAWFAGSGFGPLAAADELALVDADVPLDADALDTGALDADALDAGALDADVLDDALIDADELDVDALADDAELVLDELELVGAVVGRTVGAGVAVGTGVASDAPADLWHVIQLLLVKPKSLWNWVVCGIPG
jgi:hypothetical protein